jgi:hypothetical protein
MENQRMLSTQEAVVGGTEGGPGPTGVPPTTAAAEGAGAERASSDAQGRMPSANVRRWGAENPEPSSTASTNGLYLSERAPIC